MDTLIIENLPRNAIATAFPLVHLVTPGLDLQAWRRFALSTIDQQRGALAGILTARRNTRRHICGLVCYRRELDLALGFVMDARNLIGIDILDAKPVILALMRSVAAIARSGDCANIRFMIANGKGDPSIMRNVIALTQRYPNITCGLDILVASEDVSAESDDLKTGQAR